MKSSAWIQCVLAVSSVIQRIFARRANDQDEFQSIQVESGGLKVLVVSHNAEAAGPEAYSWLPSFLDSPEALQADIFVGCQQEALNDADLFHEYPLTFPNYLESRHRGLKWERLSEIQVPQFKGLSRQKGPDVPRHETGPGYICGQETRDRFAGSCQFMSVWANTASAHQQFLEATVPKKVDNPADWTDSWKNKGILASDITHRGKNVATIMCAHLPPTTYRSSYMRLFADMGSGGRLVTLSGDLNYRPQLPQLRDLTRILGSEEQKDVAEDVTEYMAKGIAENILANKEDMRRGLVALQSIDRPSSETWQKDLNITCNSPAEAGILPTYARFYEKYEGQVACSCLDTGLQVTYAERQEALLSRSRRCHTALANATDNSDVQRIFNITARSAEDVGDWCRSSGVNCLALLFYVCYLQNEITQGKVKLKQEKHTYSAKPGTDGPKEVSTLGWLDRTCWRGTMAKTQELLPVVYGQSAYASDHQPTATLLTLP